MRHTRINRLIAMPELQTQSIGLPKSRFIPFAGNKLARITSPPRHHSGTLLMSGKSPRDARDCGELSGNCDRLHIMVVKSLTVAVPQLMRSTDSFKAPGEDRICRVDCVESL